MASRFSSRGLLRAARAPTAVPRASTCSAQLLRSSIVPLASCALPLQQQQKWFSSSPRALGAGQSDGSLSSKLAEELQWEEENGLESSAEPDWLAEFKREGVWKIDDKPGFDEVKMTRTFGSENIQVLFSIADLDAPNPANETQAMENEAEASEEESAEADEEPSFPVRAAVTISKGPGQGGLTVDAVAEDGLFVIDAVAFYGDEKQALDMSAEGDWKRRALYMGPEFEALDENLQELFEAYLEERGINSNLALLIPDLAEWKEEREYRSWLQGVKKFVDAA